MKNQMNFMPKDFKTYARISCQNIFIKIYADYKDCSSMVVRSLILHSSLKLSEY